MEAMANPTDCVWVVARELDAAALRACRRAGALAAARGATVTVLWVPTRADATDAEVLEVRAERCLRTLGVWRAGWRVRGLAAPQGISAALAAAAADTPPTLVVTAPPPAWHWRQWLAPDLATRVARQRQWPLLLTSRGADAHYRRVVTPVRLAAAERALLRWLHAQWPTATIDLLHAQPTPLDLAPLESFAWPGPATRIAHGDEPAQALQAVQRFAAGCGVGPTDCRVVYGDGPTVIADHAARVRADLITLPAPSWRVGLQLARAGSCDVLLLPLTPPEPAGLPQRTSLPAVVRDTATVHGQP